MYLKLHKDAFFRRYQDIGYLWQQKERRSLVIDLNGAMFFEELTRKPQRLEDIVQRLKTKYSGVTAEDLAKDYLSFMQRFVPLHIVVQGEQESDLEQKERCFSYEQLQEITSSAAPHNLSVYEQEQDVNSFLTKHFTKHPHLLSLQIEITPHCNLKCVHCYLGFGTASEPTRSGLSSSQICKVLDEFRSQGGLQVTFTGGEAMLNKDLPLLLRYAREKDLDIWILSNITLLSDELLQVMQETNIAGVQVSLYSLLPKVHDAVTQVKGSCEKTKHNIKRLIAANIPVQLACPVMKENLQSFETVLKWGQEHHLEVKLNSQIFARSDFSTGNLAHRITLQDQELLIKRTLAESPVYQERLLHPPLRKICPNEPVCGAGRYMLCLEASGDYYPCPGFKLKLGNCKEQTLQDIWEHSGKLNMLRNLTNASYEKCLKCPSRSYCNLCPGKLYNESGGDMFKLSKYFCEMAHLNRRIAEDFVERNRSRKRS